MLRALARLLVDGKSDAKSGHSIRFRTHLQLALRLPNGIHDTDDVLELCVIVGVNHGLVGSRVGGPRVLALGRPLALDSGREIGKANDLCRAVFSNDVM